MAKRAQAPSAPPVELNLKTRHLTGPLTPDMKRFDMFLIDTGWNKPVSTVVRSYLRFMCQYQIQDSLYELTPEQSAEILKRDPELIGHDPTIIVYDLYDCESTRTGNYHGFRLNLGVMRSAEQAMARLQEFVRFIAANRTAERLDREVRRELHREGLDGMIKILRETSVDLLLE